MPNKLELYKKKLLYRASYRGTKENGYFIK